MELKPKVKILFICHDINQVGATIVLLNLINWINQNTSKEIIILSKNTGGLLKDFEKIAPTFVWNYPRIKYSKFLIFKIVKKIFKRKYDLHQSRIIKSLKKENIHLIYSNTLDSNDLLRIIKSEINIPVINHIHEMEFSIKTYFPESIKEDIITEINEFITVSKLCDSQFKGLVNKKIKTHIINPFINTSFQKKITVDRDILMKELGIQNDFIVGGCGENNFIKGVDKFIELSRITYKIHPTLSIKFLWVGNLSKKTILEYKFDNQLLGIPENIVFTGFQKYPNNYFNVFDVFALTSREDSFPLVAIEAATLGKPIICFEGASGIPELMDGKGGFVVPYLNTKIMMEKCLILYENKKIYDKLSAEIIQKSLAYDVNKISHKINEIIDKNLI